MSGVPTDAAERDASEPGASRPVESTPTGSEEDCGNDVAALVAGDGFVCLHSHYVPGIDDGAPAYEDGLGMLRAFREVGFSGAVATPHIRQGMFDNEPPDLRRRFDALRAELARKPDVDALPALGLGAEHFFDDKVYALLRGGQGLSYPGGHATLVELPRRRLPLNLGQSFFQLAVSGQVIVLAHPERYHDFFKTSAELEPLVAGGALLLLDLLSLVGHYGRAPRKAAERILDEGLYFAACTDMHRAKDAKLVRKAISTLEKRAGRAAVDRLLGEAPRQILRGEI